MRTPRALPVGYNQDVLRSVLILLALASTSCLRDYGDTPFACKRSASCPEGYECIDQLCTQVGSKPGDAGGLEPSYVPPDIGSHDYPRWDVWRSDLYVVVPSDVDHFSDLGGFTCAQILQCYQQCQNQACVDTCYYSGSAAGRKVMDVLEECWYQAAKGPCYYQCYPAGPNCGSCQDNACTYQINTCLAN